MIITAFPAAAREFRVPLSRVETPGFYRILLPAAYHAHGDPSSLRLLDAAGRVQSAFRHSSEAYHRIGSVPVSLKVLHSDRDSTVVEFSNPYKTALESIWLQVRNNEVSRVAELSGGESGASYYAIIDSLELRTRGNSDTISAQIAFPPTSYPSFRLCIRNRGLKPLSIIGAYTERSTAGFTAWQAVPVTGFRQTDSGRESQLRMYFPPGYRARQLLFDFEGPRYYSRTMQFPAGHSAATRVRPGAPAAIVSGDFYDTVLAVVENGPNQPLRLRRLQALRTAEYLVAWLEPGSYSIRYGDTRQDPQLNDLEELQDSLSDLSLPFLETGAEMPLAVAPEAAKPKESLLPKIFMWAAILAVLAGLIFATRALMRKLDSGH